MGVSDSAIRKAILTGRISAAALTSNPRNNRPMLFPDQAEKDWIGSGGKKGTPIQIKEVDLDPEPKGKPQRKTMVLAPVSPEINFADFTEEDGQLAENAPLAEANRRLSITLANMKNLEFLEKQRVLVPSEKIYKELFDIGKEIRLAMQAIPDQVIDNILAAPNRNAAHGILYALISDELDRLADFTTREIRILPPIQENKTEPLNPTL